MAANPITNKFDVYNRYDFDVGNDVTIQGKMLSYTHRISDINIQDGMIEADTIKKIMASALIDELLKSGYIEFTRTHEGHTGEWVYRARIFAVPDDKVRILRQNGY